MKQKKLSMAKLKTDQYMEKQLLEQTKELIEEEIEITPLPFSSKK